MPLRLASRIARARPVAVGVVLAGLLALPSAAGAEADTLYDRIGGAPVMQRIALATLSRVANDPAVNHSFAGINIDKLSVKLASHLCAVTGGGCPPSSDSLKVVHAGLDIREGEFAAIVEALRAACDANGVGEREKNELLRVLAPNKRDIVTR